MKNKISLKCSKHKTYTSPVRDEECAGSMLRVIKFVTKGYHIRKKQLAKVMARVVKGTLCTDAKDENEIVEKLHQKLCEANNVRY